MGASSRKFDKDVREGAVGLVRQTDKPIAQVSWKPVIPTRSGGSWHVTV